MTASARKQNSRYKQIQGQLGSFTGDNEQLLNDLSNYVGVNKGQGDWYKYGTPDTNGMFKSKSKYWNPKAAAQDAFNDFRDWQLDKYDDVLGNIYQANQRSQFNTDLKNMSGDYVSDYLNTYYNNSLNSLDSALKRGLLTQNSFGKANEYLNSLNNNYTSMLNSSLNNQIGDLLSDFDTNGATASSNMEKDLQSYKDNFANKYGSMNSDFYQTDYDNFINDSKNNLYTNFASNAFNELGSNPFDISDIISNAQVMSGINNTQSNGLLNAIEDTEKQKEEQIGLGNQGMF